MGGTQTVPGAVLPHWKGSLSCVIDEGPGRGAGDGGGMGIRLWAAGLSAGLVAAAAMAAFAGTDEDRSGGGVIATAQPDAGIDLYIGSGGAPEGVLAAAALRCITATTAATSTTSCSGCQQS